MRRGVMVVAVAAVVAAAFAVAVPQPDTDSPSWRYLGDEVGILLGDDVGGAMRGRLYVGVGGLWRPLVLEENRRIIPAR